MTEGEEQLIGYYFYIHGIHNLRYASPELISQTLSLYKKLDKKQKQALVAGYEKNKNKLYNLY